MYKLFYKVNNTLNAYFVIVLRLCITYFLSVLTPYPSGIDCLITYRLCKTFLHMLISVLFCNFCRGVIFTKLQYLKIFTLLHFLYFYLKLLCLSDGTLNGAPCQGLQLPLARKRPFHWISMKSRLVRAARETSKFQNWSHFTDSRRRYMAEILPIRRKTPSNQSINTFKNFCWHLNDKTFTKNWDHYFSNDPMLKSIV